jgi:hypothetical protein
MVHVCTPSYLEADAGGSLETWSFSMWHY